MNLKEKIDSFDEDIVKKLYSLSKNTIQPTGLSKSTIDKISKLFKESFMCSLPNGYTKFLGLVNGFSYNDKSIFCCYNAEIEKKFPKYSTLDLVTFNIRFYENTNIHDYIMLGKSSSNWVGYDKKTHQYVIMTNSTMTPLNEFDTFSQLVESFFNI